MPGADEQDDLFEFDQTNGTVQGLDGESDGSKRGDTESSIEQRREDYDAGAARIIGGGHHV